jgi:hypothetical protein
MGRLERRYCHYTALASTPRLQKKGPQKRPFPKTMLFFYQCFLSAQIVL